jgi:amino acid transporter
MTDGRSLAADSAGFWQAVGQSMCAGPLLSVALFGGIVAGIGGSAGPFVLVVTTIGIIGVSFVLATFAARHPNAGSIYGFFLGGTRSAGLAAFGAGIYFYGLLFLGAGGIYIGFGLVFQQFAASYLGFSPEWWVVSLIAAVAVFTLNVVGIRPTVRAQLAVLGVSAIPFLILAGKVLAVGGAHGNTWSVFNPSAPTAGDAWAAFLFCIILFLGFELSSALGEEARRPGRTIPWAMVATVAILGCFYILMQYTGTIGFGLGASGTAAWAASPDGLAILGGRYLGSWDEVWIYLSVLLDILAVASGFTTSLARGLFALGRDRVLPGYLGGLSRAKTPMRANAAILIGAFAMIGGFALAPIQPKLEAFVVTAGVGALLMLLVYVGLGALLVVNPGPRAGRAARLLAAVVAVAVAGLGIYGSVWPFPAGSARWEIWFALIGVALAAGFAVLTTVRAPKVVEARAMAAAGSTAP